MELQINDQTVTIAAEPDLPLLWVLRDLLGMTGTKFGCGMALCGACTVLVDGQAQRSCVLPVAQAAGKKITTIEGIGATPVGAALQGAWQQINVPQCGYCQAGQIMSAAALLQSQTGSERCRHRCRHVREYLPLRHLPAHTRRHQTGCKSCGANEMSAVADDFAASEGLSRREFLRRLQAMGGLLLVADGLHDCQSGGCPEVRRRRHGTWHRRQSSGVLDRRR